MKERSSRVGKLEKAWLVSVNLNTPSPNRSVWPLPRITSPPQTPMPTYNRDHRILIKIEHKPGSVPLTEKSLEELTEIISAQLKKSKATDKDVRTVKMLQSGNVSSQMVGGGEVQKLQANLDLTQALGDASIVTRSSGVVAHGVFLHKTDMEDKEVTIRYLTRKVKNALPNLTITWIVWLHVMVGLEAPQGKNDWFTYLRSDRSCNSKSDDR